MRVRFSFILEIDSACDNELQACIDAAEEVAHELECRLDSDTRGMLACVQQVSNEATA